ncbi:MAG TPA: Nif3-like dinuclear metal center hexameric protein [Microbacteriaceae bacterium]|nr:Nif3-like dinuclear metal center hexameric protein [Microbacteriaceae bacterium]
MPSTVAELAAAAESLWPVAGAEAWDAVGLVSGDPEAPVERVLLAVDAVADTVDEAIEIGADLLLTHHPLLLRGVTTVAADRYKGSIISRLIKADCALLTAHTNADVVDDGTSGALAAKLGLQHLAPIDPDAFGGGIGRVGDLPESTTLGRFASLVAAALPPTAGGVRVSGSYVRPVRRVAVCGGAGDAYLSAAAVLAADVYVTADLRHHPAQEAREQALLTGGPALIDVSHWASEWLWLENAATALRAALPEIEFIVSELRTDPWDFAVLSGGDGA